MDKTLQFTALNRLGWDSIAPARPGQPAGFFGSGGVDLEPFDSNCCRT